MANKPLYIFFLELSLARTRQWCSTVFTRLMTINVITILIAVFPLIYNIKITPENTPDFTIGKFWLLINSKY